MGFRKDRSQSSVLPPLFAYRGLSLVPQRQQYNDKQGREIEICTWTIIHTGKSGGMDLYVPLMACASGLHIRDVGRVDLKYKIH